MTGTAPNKTLVVSSASQPAPPSAQIVEVAKKHKVSPIKQLRESMALRMGGNNLASNEYYAAEVYRPELTGAEKKQFIGEKKNKALNQSMSPRDIARISDFLQDKVLYMALLNQLGIPSTKAQAVYSRSRGCQRRSKNLPNGGVKVGHFGLDLSRFRAAPGAHLSGLSFKCQGAFPAQC